MAGMFGSSAPNPNQKWVDALQLAGAALQDIGSAGTTQNLSGMIGWQSQQRERAQQTDAARRLAQSVSGAFGAGGQAAVAGGLPKVAKPLTNLPRLNPAEDHPHGATQPLIGPEALPRLQSPAGPDFSNLYGQIAEASAAGVNVMPYLEMLRTAEGRQQRDAYLGTLPEEERAGAALNPSAYAEWDRDSRLPSFHNIGNGTLLSANRRENQVTEAYRSPIPAEPMTTDRAVGAVLQKVMSGAKLSPGEDAIYRRYLEGAGGGAAGGEDYPTPNRNLGLIQQKIARGEQLTPGEQQLYEDSRQSRLDPTVAAILGLPGAGGGGAASALGGTAPPAPEAPRDAKQRRSGTIYKTPRGPLRWTAQGWVEP